MHVRHPKCNSGASVDIGAFKQALTTDDKRYISRNIDAELAALTSDDGKNVEEIAQAAVKNATKKWRQAQNVASRTSQKREALRRASAG